MSNRQSLFALIRVAGYHDDLKAGARLFCENRISRAAYDEQFNKGRQMRANGVKCGCSDCERNGVMIK